MKDSFVLKGRKTGKILALSMQVFDCLKKGESVMVLGNKDPDRIIHFLKENGMESVAEPVYKTHELYPDPDTGVLMRYKLEEPILQGYNIKQVKE